MVKCDACGVFIQLVTALLVVFNKIVSERGYYLILPIFTAYNPISYSPLRKFSLGSFSGLAHWFSVHLTIKGRILLKNI